MPDHASPFRSGIRSRLARFRAACPARHGRHPDRLDDRDHSCSRRDDSSRHTDESGWWRSFRHHLRRRCPHHHSQHRLRADRGELAGRTTHPARFRRELDQSHRPTNRRGARSDSKHRHRSSKRYRLRPSPTRPVGPFSIFPPPLSRRARSVRPPTRPASRAS